MDFLLDKIRRMVGLLNVRDFFFKFDVLILFRN